MQSIRESGDSGLPAVLKDGPVSKAFMELAESLARQIAMRNAQPETVRSEIRVLICIQCAFL